MFRLALKMLIGDRAKYFGIIIGLSFASLIITQQSATFVGIMARTYGFISDTSQPNIWVMDPKVQYIDDIKPIKSTQLFRVKSVEGVDWAVPLYRGLIRGRLKNGTFQNCYVAGIDDATLIGGPAEIIEGKITDLRLPDAIIVDQIAAETKLSEEINHTSIPLKVGDVLELNDRRCVVVGICKSSRSLLSQPLIYTTYQRAISLAPQEQKLLSFILAHSKPGLSAASVCQHITKATSLIAYTQNEFENVTVNYFLTKTGIPINFGVTVLLGFVIGIAIAGQTFHNFTLDNFKYFGTFKAMGASNTLLIKMILLQAIWVGVIGWSIGLGGAALFGFLLRNTELSFLLPWQLILITAASLFFMCMISAILSILKILKLQPAIVFKS
jgi:putative ABC transport system permease protein